MSNLFSISRVRSLMLFPSGAEALTFIMHITGLPRSIILPKHSASAACGASSVIRNRMRSAFLAASKAICSSSSPSKAPMPGTSVISSPFQLYCRTSLVVLCAPFPMDNPSPFVRISINVDFPAIVRPNNVTENLDRFSFRFSRSSLNANERLLNADLISISCCERRSVALET